MAEVRVGTASVPTYAGYVSSSKRDGDGRVTLNVKGYAKPLPVSRAYQGLFKQM